MAKKKDDTPRVEVPFDLVRKDYIYDTEDVFEDKSDIFQILNILERSEQNLFIYYTDSGSSLKQTAEHFGVSKSIVYHSIRKIKDKLRKELGYDDN